MVAAGGKGEGEEFNRDDTYIHLQAGAKKTEQELTSTLLRFAKEGWGILFRRTCFAVRFTEGEEDGRETRRERGAIQRHHYFKGYRRSLNCTKKIP